LTLALAQQALTAQPFSRLLGARLVAFGEGEAILELDIRADLRQQHGYVHGGVLAYAADNALTFAGGGALGATAVTAGLTIDYLRPAVGHTLRARATVVHAGRRQAVCRCEIYTLDSDGDGDATPCAVAQGTVVAARAAS
jgi:uncharacterized protein (TIGR00369 family)